MADHLRTELVLAALDMALWNRRPAAGVIHHADHGCQYTSLAFGSRCQEAGVVPSFGSRGDCFDNAITESFFATLECERLQRQTFRTHAQARTAIFDFIEGFYNTHRRHSALGYQSPTDWGRWALRRASRRVNRRGSACLPSGRDPNVQRFWPTISRRSRPRIPPRGADRGSPLTGRRSGDGSRST